MPVGTLPMWNAFHALEEEDSLLLEFVSLVFHPVEQQTLISHYNRYASEAQRPEITGLASIERLLESGLLVKRSFRVCCERSVIEDISTHAAEAGRAELMCQVLESDPIHRNLRHFSFFMARLKLYQGEPGVLLRTRSFSSEYRQGYGLSPPGEELGDFFEELVRGMSTMAPLEFYPQDFARELTSSLLREGLEQAQEAERPYQWLQGTLPPDGAQGINFLFFTQCVARNDTPTVERLLAMAPPAGLLWCWAAARGERPSQDLVTDHTRVITRLPFLNFLFFLACLAAEDEVRMNACIEEAKAGYDDLYSMLWDITHDDPDEDVEELLRALPESAPEPLFLFQAACVLYWSGYRKELGSLGLDSVADKFENSGYIFLSQQLWALHKIAQGEGGPTPFLQQVRSKKPWQRLVDGLENLFPKTNKVTNEDTAVQILWELKMTRVHPLKARIQKWGKNGGWTSGRKVELQEIGKYYPHDLDEHDRKVYERLVISHYHQSTEKGHLLFGLLGHPRVLDPSGRPLRLTFGKPEVQVKSLEGGFELCSGILRAHGIAYRKVGSAHLELMEVGEGLCQFLDLLSKHEGLCIPEQQLPHVSKALLEASRNELQVTSDRSLQEDGEDVPVQEGLLLRLTPEGVGLRTQVLIAPMGPGGPVYVPGKGNEYLLLSKDGTPTTFVRDLKNEKTTWNSLRQQVTHLNKQEQVVKEPLQCLELLESLSDVPAERIRIEWPEGAKFQIKNRLNWQDFGLSVHQKNDWLAVDGNLQLSQDESWDLAELLRQYREQNTRFLELANGDFVALSEEFHRRLGALQRAAREPEGDIFELDPLSASVLLEDCQMLESDLFWKGLQGRIKEAKDFEPELPSTFQATLRPYQEEGFRWLARAAFQGVGACLADDMGLGKTIQALALILSRSGQTKGPSLIVAPTSVCFNWIEEIKRFTPTLTPHLYSELDRKAGLQDLSGTDVMVVSYGLLVNENERFKELEWSNLVLDEAQAIKNPTTKRFKAVVGLTAEFRLATTGTPIENKLDEIWSLFRFLNPGLLGTRKAFDSSYSGLEDVEEKRESLRRLLSPFLLRRLKSQVLDDLPPRTDATLTVEMSGEERLHYEGLRLGALEKLESDKKSDAISILAELTRLRMACCHPRLVDPASSLEGAKLKLLLRLLDDLKQSGHRALIFSQFVGHLQLVKQELDRRGDSHLYLDGKTPAKLRGKLVQQFQEGEQDFFLISLKAGGTGLNLTAANYVIHLDPWWNPAVEDQASDRAHRIGQKQAVTVYRLITRGTIEEKILALHKDKRDLADTLLSGTDKAGKMTSQELLGLMRESVLAT